MPRPDEDVPVEPAENNVPPPDADDSDPSPSDVDSQPSTATDDDATRSIRDIQTRNGRELAEEKRQREAAQQQVVQLGQQVNVLRDYVQQIGTQLNSRQQAERAAYLQRLKPEDRMRAEIEMLKQEVAASRQGRVAPPTDEQPSDAEIQQYMAQRSKELIDEANDDFGLDGDEALGDITADTPGVDWSNESTFKKSVRKLARQRALGKGTSVADPKKTNGDGGRTANIGGRPNSARPAGGGRSTLDIEQETNRVFTNNRSTKGGIQARKAGLLAIQKKARENLDRASR